MVKDLVLFGGGGHARDVLQVVRDINAESRAWNLLGFLDGNPDLAGKAIHEYEVLGGPDWLGSRPEVSVCIAIGESRIRRKVACELENASHVSLIHPSVSVGNNVQIARGSIICAGNILTCDISVDEFSLLNLACTVTHNCYLRPFVSLSPGVNVSGNVTLLEGAMIGTGTCIIQGVTVGEWSIVGAGAVVTKDVPPNTTSVGAPAQVIKTREPGWHLA